MATYKEIKKGTWRAEESFGYLPNGQQDKIRKQGFKTKKEAVAYVREEGEKRQKGYSPTTANKIIFKDYLEKWFTEYKIFTLQPTSITNYRGRMNNHIIPNLGDYKLSQITVSAVQDFYNGLIRGGQKASSAKKVMEIVTGVLKYACKNKLINTVPTDIEKQPFNQPDKGVWTKEELDYFLKKVDDDYLYLPVFLDALTGVRPGELCGITWSNINFKDRIINIEKQALVQKETGEVYITFELKTKTSKRDITIPNTLINYLREIKVQRDAKDSDYVILELSNPNPSIPCKSNNLNSNFCSKIEKLNKKNGYKLSNISLNGLRHTHTTMLVSRNINIKVIASRLGHADIATTLKYYTHVTKEMENATADLLDKLF